MLALLRQENSVWATGTWVKFLKLKTRFPRRGNAPTLRDLLKGVGVLHQIEEELRMKFTKIFMASATAAVLLDSTLTPGVSASANNGLDANDLAILDLLSAPITLNDGRVVSLPADLLAQVRNELIIQVVPDDIAEAILANIQSALDKELMGISNHWLISQQNY